MKEWIAANFGLFQGILLFLFVTVGFWFFRPRNEGVGFRVREYERETRGTKAASGNGNQQMKSPHALPGIRTDGLPHEILGISEDAPLEAIQRAYRELMKRYHPDKVGPAGSHQWKEAQKFAETINNAKDAMVKGKRFDRA